MKDQNEFLPRSLAILPQLDAFNPGLDSADGGGASTPATVFDEVNFTMISSNPNTNGLVIDYTELHLASPSDGGTTPIHQSNDDERCMLLVGIPKPNANWSMALQISNESGSDTVEMQCIEGKYLPMREAAATKDNFLAGSSEYFYTLVLASDKYETYVNTNQFGEVLRLIYKDANTLETFMGSFLARTQA